jgi:phytanoyl-CoA hydroxylase
MDIDMDFDLETKTEHPEIEKIYPDVSRLVHRWPSSDGPHESYPAPGDVTAFRSYFDREGFIVVRNAVPRSLCQSALDAFRSEVKPSPLPFLRHEFTSFDKHVFTEAGFMKHPILNIPDISDRHFGRFKKASLDVFTHTSIQRAVEALYGEPGRLVDTLFFEGNQNTWPHRDGRYVDAEERGRALGILAAAEDIDPLAGRFYVCPRSHLVQVAGEEEGPCEDPNSREYKRLMADFVVDASHECVAPVLGQGDIVIFSCRMVHGSLATKNSRLSRSSLNAHWIPASQKLWQLGGEPEPSQSLQVNGVRITSYGSQHPPLRLLRLRLGRMCPPVIKRMLRPRR